MSAGLLAGEGQAAGGRPERCGLAGFGGGVVGQEPPTAGTRGRWKRLDVASRLAPRRDPAPPHLQTETFLLLWVCGNL